MSETKEEAALILLFDGECNLCSKSVQFVLKHDKRHHFMFASLQSAVGIKILESYHYPAHGNNTVVFIEHGKLYTTSTAALRVCRYLDGLIPLAYIFIIVPRFIRNKVYQYIANHRIKWFGKPATCFIPSLEWKQYFLD